MRRLRRRFLVTALVCGCALTSAGGALGGSPPHAQLTGFACQKALDPPDRAVSVKAVMRPLPGTKKLSLKFDLLEKASGAPSAKPVVGAGDLGIWVTPKDPTLGQQPGDVWQFNKVVYDLDAPARYEFRATFRWLGAHHKVLGTVVRITGMCHQRELRPDLLVKSVSVSSIASKPHKERYTAVIANRGATASGPFEVLFTPGDQSSPQTKTLATLAPHDTTTASFVGPVCDAGSPPSVVADATSQVDDYDRSNNAWTVVCPSSPPPGTTAARR